MSTYVGLAQENGFILLHIFSVEAGKKQQPRSCATAREACNKYDLIATPCF
jgi:hypothetical protein